MTNRLSENVYGNGSAPMKLANTVVEDPVVIPAPVVRRSRNRRARPTLARQNPTVSLVIPVRNEARNIAWVLESRPTGWPAAAGVAGKGNDAQVGTSFRNHALVNAACFPAARGPRSRDNGSRAPPAPCAWRTHASLRLTAVPTRRPGPEHCRSWRVHSSTDSLSIEVGPKSVSSLT
jgi:hypothetical protein